jgi:hypothetical protein
MQLRYGGASFETLRAFPQERVLVPLRYLHGFRSLPGVHSGTAAGGALRVEQLGEVLHAEIYGPFVFRQPAARQQLVRWNGLVYGRRG